MPSPPAVRYPVTHVLSQFDDLDAASQVLGVEPRSLMRWRETGVSWRKADMIAGRLGLHPVDLWPSWFDDALVDDDGAVIASQSALFTMEHQPA